MVWTKRDFNDPAYRKMRAEVRKRDGYKCQFPGCNSRKRLQVHHIIPWSQNVALRHESRNCCLLCVVHHKQVSQGGNELSYAAVFAAIVARNMSK